MRNTLRKTLCVAFSLLIMIPIMSAFYVFAADSYKVTVNNPQGLFSDVSKNYKAGDTFDLNVSLKIHKPLCNGTIFVRFDPEALFVESAAKGSDMKGDSVSFVAAGTNSEAYQNKRQFIAINFSCGTDAADYSTDKLLFTMKFNVKNSISSDQIIKVDFETLDGILDPMDIKTEFMYIDKNAVVEEQRNNIRLSAELTGGSSQPATEVPTTVAPEPETTEAPVVTTAAPEPETTEAPEVTTAAPEPEATEAPEITTAAPEPETTEAPEATTAATEPETTEAPEATTAAPEPVSTTVEEKVDISNWTVTGIKDKTYNGKEQTQKFVVTNGEKVADVSVKYYDNKNAGKALMIIEGKGEYKGSIYKSFKINKAKQPMTVKVSKKTVKVKKLKKKAVTLKALKVKKAKGKVTYAKYKKGSTKRVYKLITVNKKTGKIKFKKGTYKKGTVKIRIRITAKGNLNYKSKKLIKTVKVKIK